MPEILGTLTQLRRADPRWLPVILGSSVDEADHAVLVSTPTVDNAGTAVLDVAVEKEVVAHHLHLEQGLVDRHRAGSVVLLPDDQRSFAFHRDRHHIVGAVWRGRIGF